MMKYEVNILESFLFCQSKKNYIYIYIYIQIIKLFYSLVRSFNFYGYQDIVDENRSVGIFITSYVTLEFETNLNPASKYQLLQSSILKSESS